MSSPELVPESGDDEYDETPPDTTPILPLTSVDEDLRAFVDGTLQNYLTSGDPHSASRWCTSWEEHPDAVHRLMGIYMEWRNTVADGPGALHEFYRDVLDYHLPFLVDKERGVFRECDREHTPHRRLDQR